MLSMADVPASPEPSEAAAERAAARGHAADAPRLLETVTERDPSRAGTWLKLAAMCRSQGNIDAALGAVAGALRVDPLVFLPLVLKAGLLDAAGRGGEAG